MRLMYGVSLMAVATAVYGSPALAQSQTNINGTNAVSQLSLLPTSAAGLAELNVNLPTAISINANATVAQQRQAVIDNTITSDNGLVLSDLLGTRLNGIFAGVNTVTGTAASSTSTTFSNNFRDLLRQINGISQADSGVAKNFIANGTANGTTPAVGLSLPPGGVFAPYDRVYNPPAGANTVGDARPGQARPNNVTAFTQPDFFGAPTSNTSILAGLRGNASYPSGHTTFGYTTSLLFAELIPERFREGLTRASEYGNSRIVLDVHYPLDIIAGRILATYDLVQILNNNPQYLNQTISVFAVGNVTTTNNFPALFASAQGDLRGLLTSGCGGLTIAACAASGTPDRFSNAAQNQADYTARLTYGLPSVGPTNLAPVVPTGAEVLLATRFPYLNAAQRREVLATTELPSGVPLDDGSGYARLNLYAAAGGYGAFNGPVTITMDATQGGFSAFDTFDNNIGGAGSLTKAGTGTLQLTGTNSYAGGTTIAGGTLIGSAASFGTGSILDNATLVVNQTVDGTLANAISGSGALIKAGAGVLRLTGNDTLAGPTFVGAGRLAVNGFLGNSLVTVGTGATLGGIGTVGGIAAQAGAVVAPGGSINQLNVNGNLSFAPGSVYRGEANAAGQSDRIAATGTAALQGGTVQVLAANGNYDPRTRYTILSANGGVSGGFAGATSNLAFLTPSLSYGATDAFLTLTRNDIAFAGIAQTRNQAGAASGVQSAGPGSAIYTRVVGLTTPEAIPAFASLSGEIQASAVTAEFETAHLVRETVLERLRGGYGQTGPLAGLAGSSLQAAYSADLPGRNPAPVAFTVLDPQVFAFWGQGFGSFGSTRSDGNAGGLTRDTAGFVAGADVTLDGNVRVGLAGGYTDTSIDVRSRLSSGTIESGFGAIYAGAALGAANLRVGAVYADNSLTTRRGVVFAGFQDSEFGRSGGSTAQVFGELGYKVAFAGGVIEPFVGGAAIRISQDRFTERGGTAALTGFDRSNDLATVTAGLRAETALGLFGLPITARALAGYRHAFGDVVPTALLAFGPGAQPFTTAGVPIDRDAFVGEAGLDYRISPAMKIGLSYSGQIGERANDNGVRGEFTYRF